MAYVTPNYTTKKALKDAVKSGKAVRVFQPNRMTGSDDDFKGKRVTVEGPHYPEPHRWYGHYPEPHRWYGQVDVSVDGVVTRVR